jgi:hypothetical protein
LALLWVGIAHASVPNVLHFSGALKSEGAAFTGTMAMTFALYDGAEADETLWAETQSVAVVANRFQILLGINVTFDTTTFDATALHLGITVESEDEMTPRMRLASVPYAMRAGGLTCTGCVGKAQLEAGLLSPVATSGDYNDLINKPVLSAMLTGPGSTGALAKYTAAATLADSVVHEVNGQVGVGTSSPQARLDVAGGVKFGNDTDPCTTDKAGTIRWTGSRFEGCSGLTWVPLRSLSATCATVDTTCDGNDDDCDGAIDEDYVSLITNCGTGVCAATGATSCVEATVVDSCTPGAPTSSDDTTCNGIDEDCSGQADEDYQSLNTSCGTGPCAATGTTSCVAGNVANSCTPNPPLSADDTNCNNIDDDCSGEADEDYQSLNTNCGTGVCAATGATSCVEATVVDSCTPGAPTSSDDTTCNGIDEDCSGQADEDYQSLNTSCGTGLCAATGTTSCVVGNVANSCTPNPPLSADDTNCNNIDDDCNGEADEDYQSLNTNCGTGVCAAAGTTSCSAGSVADSCAPTTPPAGYDAACSLVSCPANATGGPSCVCKPGYSGTPTWNGASWDGTCTDINECANSPCGTGGTCTNLENAYSCSCASGYDGGGTNTPCTCTAINGGWSSWSGWSGCSVSCGGGTQSRSRSCNSPSPNVCGAACSGSTSQSQSCNTQACCKGNGGPCSSDSDCCNGTCYGDADGDGYAGSGSKTCHSSPSSGSDCCDSDANAHPGQTSYFTSQRSGCGGYDYDCDGSDGKRWGMMRRSDCKGPYCDELKATNEPSWRGPRTFCDDWPGYGASTSWTPGFHPPEIDCYQYEAEDGSAEWIECYFQWLDYPQRKTPNCGATCILNTGGYYFLQGGAGCPCHPHIESQQTQECR